jgi:ubiquinone/menaquinone biosynthesis C-methylase UbiE
MAFTDPRKNLESLGLHEGQVVADLGAGSGFYSLAAAQMVSGGGKVYAVDVQAELLARLKNSAHQAHLNNIEVVHGDLEVLGGTKIREMTVDVAIVSNVLFQIEKKEDFLKEVRRILKPDGRTLLVDWSDSFGGLGPQAEQVFAEAKARELFTKQGFKEITKIDAGDHHYGLIFRKS